MAYVPALEDVLVWDVKKGQMVVAYIHPMLLFAYHLMQLAMWHETGHRAEVTCIKQSPHPDSFAVGYADGSIRLWSASSGSVLTTFNGHKKSVTALGFDEQGTRLASGSQDTDLIVWDVISETGLYRYVPTLALQINLNQINVYQASWASRPDYRHSVYLHE